MSSMRLAVKLSLQDASTEVPPTIAGTTTTTGTTASATNDGSSTTGIAQQGAGSKTTSIITEVSSSSAYSSAATFAGMNATTGTVVATAAASTPFMNHSSSTGLNHITTNSSKYDTTGINTSSNVSTKRFKSTIPSANTNTTTNDDDDDQSMSSEENEASLNDLNDDMDTTTTTQDDDDEESIVNRNEKDDEDEVRKKEQQKKKTMMKNQSSLAGVATGDTQQRSSSNNSNNHHRKMNNSNNNDHAAAHVIQKQYRMTKVTTKTVSDEKQQQQQQRMKSKQVQKKKKKKKDHHYRNKKETKKFTKSNDNSMDMDTNDDDDDDTDTDTDTDDSKSYTVEPPTQSVIEHMASIPTTICVQNIVVGLRVKVLFDTPTLKWYGGYIGKVYNNNNTNTTNDESVVAIQPQPPRSKRIKISYDDGTTETTNFPDRKINQIKPTTTTTPTTTNSHTMDSNHTTTTYTDTIIIDAVQNRQHMSSMALQTAQEIYIPKPLSSVLVVVPPTLPLDTVTTTTIATIESTNDNNNINNNNHQHRNKIPSPISFPSNDVDRNDGTTTTTTTTNSNATVGAGVTNEMINVDTKQVEEEQHQQEKGKNDNLDDDDDDDDLYDDVMPLHSNTTSKASSQLEVVGTTMMMDTSDLQQQQPEEENITDTPGNGSSQEYELVEMELSSSINNNPTEQTAINVNSETTTTTCIPQLSSFSSSSSISHVSTTATQQLQQQQQLLFSSSSELKNTTTGSTTTTTIAVNRNQDKNDTVEQIVIPVDDTIVTTNFVASSPPTQQQIQLSHNDDNSNNNHHNPNNIHSTTNMTDCEAVVAPVAVSIIASTDMTNDMEVSDVVMKEETFQQHHEEQCSVEERPNDQEQIIEVPNFHSSVVDDGQEQQPLKSKNDIAAKIAICLPEEVGDIDRRKENNQDHASAAGTSDKQQQLMDVPAPNDINISNPYDVDSQQQQSLTQHESMVAVFVPTFTESVILDIPTDNVKNGNIIEPIVVTTTTTTTAIPVSGMVLEPQPQTSITIPTEKLNDDVIVDNRDGSKLDMTSTTTIIDNDAPITTTLLENNAPQQNDNHNVDNVVASGDPDVTVAIMNDVTSSTNDPTSLTERQPVDCGSGINVNYEATKNNDNIESTEVADDAMVATDAITTDPILTMVDDNNPIQEVIKEKITPSTTADTNSSSIIIKTTTTSDTSVAVDGTFDEHVNDKMDIDPIATSDVPTTNNLNFDKEYLPTNSAIAPIYVESTANSASTAIDGSSADDHKTYYQDVPPFLLATQVDDEKTSLLTSTVKVDDNMTSTIVESNLPVDSTSSTNLLKRPSPQTTVPTQNDEPPKKKLTIRIPIYKMKQKSSNSDSVATTPKSSMHTGDNDMKEVAGLQSSSTNEIVETENLSPRQLKKLIKLQRKRQKMMAQQNSSREGGLEMSETSEGALVDGPIYTPANEIDAMSSNENGIELDDSQWVQCDKCGKWRIIPTSVVQELPKQWYCSDNKYDPKHSSCDVPQQTDQEVAREKKKRLKKKQRKAAERAAAAAASLSQKSETQNNELTTESRTESVVERSPRPPRDTIVGFEKATKQQKRASTMEESQIPELPTATESRPPKKEKKHSSSTVKRGRSVESMDKLVPPLEDPIHAVAVTDAVKPRGRGRPRRANNTTTATTTTTTISTTAKESIPIVGGSSSVPTPSTENGENLDWVLCEKCDKWRKLPFHVSADELPDVWTCSMNTWNPTLASCDAPEEKSEGLQDIGVFGSNGSVAGKLTYRHLIFSSNGRKANRPISEKACAAESIFAAHFDEDVAPNKVLYADSSAYISRGRPHISMDDNEGMSVLELMSHSKLWQELRGVSSPSHQHAPADHPPNTRLDSNDSVRMNSYIYDTLPTDLQEPIKEYVLRVLDTDTLSGDEVVLRIQRLSLNNDNEKILPYCTTTVIVTTLCDLVKIGTVECIQKIGTSIRNDCWNPHYRRKVLRVTPINDQHNIMISSVSKEKELQQQQQQQQKRRLSFPMKLSKPWKRTKM